MSIWSLFPALTPYDRYRIVSSVMLRLLSKESELTEDLKCIKKYGLVTSLLLENVTMKCFFLTVMVVCLTGIPLIHYYGHLGII